MVALGRHEEAIRIGQESIESCRALIAKNPDYPHNCILLLDTIDIVSREMELLGQVENAVQLSEKAVADATGFLAKYDEESSQSNFSTRLNIAQSNLVRVLQRSNKHSDLIKAYERQIEYYSNPEEISKYKLRLIDTHRSIASTYLVLRNSIDGIQHCDKAIELAKAVRSSTNENGNLSVVLLDIVAQTLDLKSRLLLLVGKNEEAIHCVSEAIEIGTRNNLRYRVFRAYIQGVKGNLVDAIIETDEVVNQIRSSNDLYNLACLYSICLEHSADVQQLQETGFQNRNLGDLAIGALKAAIVSGYRDVSHMSQDADLRSIRDRNDYKSITRILSLASISQQSISNRDWKTVATQSERASKEIEDFLEMNPDETWATTLLLEGHRRTIAAETLQNQIDSKLITIQQQVKSYRKFGQKDANADTWDIESKSRLIDYAKLATQRDEPTSVLRLLERATFLFEEPTSNNPTARRVYCHALACRAQANVDAGRIENGLRDWDLALSSAEEPDVGEFKIRRAYAEFHKTKSAGIVDSIVELENDRKLSASALFHLACFFAKVAESTDSQTSDYHDRVWLFLDRAINRGFADLDALRSHAALDDLRNHDEYSVVFTRVEQNLVRYFP
jgi:tetratricopeptide (TPR) repeat protein